MSGKRNIIDLDPDYEDVSVQQIKRQRVLEKDAKDATIKKIEDIVRTQFGIEIQNKEHEVNTVDQRLCQARLMMDRLRACIVANYYGSTDQNRYGLRTVEQTTIHPAVKAHLGKTVKGTVPPPSHTVTSNEDQSSTIINTTQIKPVTNPVNDKPDAVKLETFTSPNELRDSRFKIKKRIIVGNVSKCIPVEKRESNDQSTHKWMVYVRGCKDFPRIDGFVKKIWFFLHPSYRPNDLVEICQPPFHLTRRGWGEFPIRIQVHFTDGRNKKVDIIHNIKLDRTYTGLQTIGAETVVDVELERENQIIPKPISFTSTSCTDSSSVSLEPTKPSEASEDGQNLIQTETDVNQTIVHSPMKRTCIKKEVLEDQAHDQIVKETPVGVQKDMMASEATSKTPSVSPGQSQPKTIYLRCQDANGNMLLIPKRILSENSATTSQSQTSKTPSVVTKAPTPQATTRSSLHSVPNLTNTKITNKINHPIVKTNLLQSPIAQSSNVTTFSANLSASSFVSNSSKPNVLATAQKPSIKLMVTSKGLQAVQTCSTGNSQPNMKSLLKSNSENIHPHKNQQIHLPISGIVGNKVTNLCQSSNSSTQRGNTQNKCFTITNANQSSQISPASNTNQTCNSSSNLLPQNQVSLKIVTENSFPQTQAITKIISETSQQNQLAQPVTLKIIGGNNHIQPSTSKAFDHKSHVRQTLKIVGGNPEQMQQSFKLVAGTNQVHPNLKSVTAENQVQPALKFMTGTNQVQPTLKSLDGINQVPSNFKILCGNSKQVQQTVKTGVQTHPLSKVSAGNSLLNNKKTYSLLNKNMAVSQHNLKLHNHDGIKYNVNNKTNGQIQLVFRQNQLEGLHTISSTQQSSNNLIPHQLKVQADGQSTQSNQMSILAKDVKPFFSVTNQNVFNKIHTDNHSVNMTVKQQLHEQRIFKLSRNHVYDKDLEKKTHVWRKNKLVKAEENLIPPLKMNYYDDMITLIKAAVQRHPLVSQDVDKSVHPYCAKSYEKWLKWNIGKRRASEWQRASWVRKYIIENLKSDVFKGKQLWSTKQIMYWCRLHAFSPHYLETKKDSPPLRVPLIDKEAPAPPSNSLSDVNQIINQLPCDLKSCDSDDDVDIIHIESPPTIKVKLKKEPEVISTDSPIYLPLSETAEFVQDTCQKIGVKLKPVNIEDNVYSSTSADMVYTAMTQFVEDMLRSSFKQKQTRSRSDDTISTEDVRQAILTTPKTDFLSNNNLGIKPTDVFPSFR